MTEFVASNKCFTAIKHYEPLRCFAYKDYSGTLRVGYYHAKNVKSSDVINDEIANNYLKEDIQECESRINRLTLNPNQNQFDALVVFIFYFGISSMIESDLLKLIRENIHSIAIYDEFLKTNNVNEGFHEKMNRLKRCRTIAELYFTGKLDFTA